LQTRRERHSRLHCGETNQRTPAKCGSKTDLLGLFTAAESPLPSKARFLSLMLAKLEVVENAVKSGRGGL
jgi:hypothetical protein